MRRSSRWAGAVVLALAVVALTAFGVTSASGQGKKAIIIGAAVDLTSSMKPFDSPALAGAQIQAKKLAAAGGPNFQIKVCNHQLKKQKSCAAQLIQAGAKIAIVTCDVEYGAAATQEFLNKGILTLAPCVDHRPDGPAALRREGQARLHGRRHRAGRGLGGGRVRLLARLAHGDRRQGQLPRLLPQRLRRVREAVPGARREDRRSARPSPRSTRRSAT